MQLVELALEFRRDDVALARYKLAFEDHIKTRGGDYSNLSLLLNTKIYQQVVENPETRNIGEIRSDA